MNLTGKAKLAGIIGWPVAHSLSPQLHGHWLQQHGIDGALLPLATPRQDFAAVIRGVRLAGFKGLNVTVPHKQAAFAIAHRLDAAAKIAGAANLLIFDAQGLILGCNTDATGLMQSLREELGDLRGRSAVLLGAGGAACGAALALSMLGADTIHLLNRDENRAKALAGVLAPQLQARLLAGPLSHWDRVAGAVALAVNATSAGMGTNPPLALALSALDKKATVCDLVYSPLDTPLLKEARALGYKSIDGLGMLMHQAVPSFEAFFGVRPQVTQDLRRWLEKVLRVRQA